MLKINAVLLRHMLKDAACDNVHKVVNKTIWVKLLKAASMDDHGLAIWHAEFERRAPIYHHQFLTLLNIAEPETLPIRKQVEKYVNR